MSEYDAWEEAVLSEARSGLECDDLKKVATFSSLSLAISAGKVPSLPETEFVGHGISLGSKAASSALLGDVAPAVSTVAKILALGGVLGGAIGFFGGYLSFSESALEESSPVHSTHAVIRQPVRTVEDPIEVKGGDASFDATPTTDRPQEIEKEAPQETGSRQAIVVEKIEKEVPAPLSFYEEMSYLRRAQASLKKGDAQFTWGLMQSLDELSPRGVLIQEREVTKVLALCALGNSKAAQRVAGRFLNANKASPYASRLKGSCALPENNLLTNRQAGKQNGASYDTNSKFNRKGLNK